MNLEHEAKQRQAIKAEEKINKESTTPKGRGIDLLLGRAVGYTRYFILK